MSAVRRTLQRGLVLSALVAVACAGGPRRHVPIPVVIYRQDFATADSLAGLEFSDRAAWQHFQGPEGGALELVGASDYSPPVRSPRNVALVLDRSFGSFTLDVEMRQTGREYGHRDLCLFFGFQSPSRYYYVHLASQADPNAHNVFRVQDAPRTSMLPRRVPHHCELAIELSAIFRNGSASSRSGRTALAMPTQPSAHSSRKASTINTLPTKMLPTSWRS